MRRHRSPQLLAQGGGCRLDVLCKQNYGCLSTDILSSVQKLSQRMIAVRRHSRRFAGQPRRAIYQEIDNHDGNRPQITFAPMCHDALLRHRTYFPQYRGDNAGLLYYKPRKGIGQQGLFGFIQDMSKLKRGRRSGIAAVVLGFGGAIVAVDRMADPAHSDDWQVLLESGQVDLITDFSSALWTPDATEHTDVPSVKELMMHLTLFQRHLWFGATSDAPDVVQIVQHCLPHKMPKGGGVDAKCESVDGFGDVSLD